MKLAGRRRVILAGAPAFLLLGATPAAAAADPWLSCDGFPRQAGTAAALSVKPAKANGSFESRLTACNVALAQPGDSSPLRVGHLLRGRAALNIILNKGAAADADLAEARSWLLRAGVTGRAAEDLRHGLDVGRLLRAAMNLTDRPSSQVAGEIFRETNKFDLPKLHRLGTLASIDPGLSLPEREIYSQMFRINPVDMRQLIEALSWSGAHVDAAAYWEQYLRVYETYPAPADPGLSPAPYRRFPLVHRVEHLSSAALEIGLSSSARRQELLLPWLKQLSEENERLKPRLKAYDAKKSNAIGAVLLLDEFGRTALATNVFLALAQATKGDFAKAQASLFQSTQCNVLVPRRCIHPAQKQVASLLLTHDYAGKDGGRIESIAAALEPKAIIRRNFAEWDGERILAAMTVPLAPALPPISVEESEMQAAPGAALSAQPIFLRAHWKTSAEPALRKMAMLLGAARSARKRGYTHLMPVWTTPDHGLTEPLLTDHPERLEEQQGDQMIAVLLNLADVPQDKRVAVSSVAVGADEVIGSVPAELVP